jgi:hypothetical protein
MKLNHFATNPLHSMQTCQNKTEIQTVLADNLLILATIAICGKTSEKIIGYLISALKLILAN